MPIAMSTFSEVVVDGIRRAMEEREKAARLGDDDGYRYWSEREQMEIEREREDFQRMANATAANDFMNPYPYANVSGASTPIQTTSDAPKAKPEPEPEPAAPLYPPRIELDLD